MQELEVGLPPPYRSCCVDGGGWKERPTTRRHGKARCALSLSGRGCYRVGGRPCFLPLVPLCVAGPPLQLACAQRHAISFRGRQQITDRTGGRGSWYSDDSIVVPRDAWGPRKTLVASPLFLNLAGAISRQTLHPPPVLVLVPVSRCLLPPAIAKLTRGRKASTSTTAATAAAEILAGSAGRLCSGRRKRGSGAV